MSALVFYILPVYVVFVPLVVLSRGVLDLFGINMALGYLDLEIFPRSFRIFKTMMRKKYINLEP